MSNAHRRCLRYPILLSALLSLAACGAPEAARLTVRPGITRISEEQITSRQSITLHDGWEFHWQRFVMPGEIAIPDAIVAIPAPWTQYRLNDRALPGEGYATYRTRVHVQTDEPVALRIWKIGSASAIWINGRNVLNSGIVGPYREDTTPGYQRTVVFVPVHQRVLDIVIHVANFDHRRGGIREPIEIGLVPGIRTLAYTGGTLEIFSVGVVLVILIYHFLLFLADRSRRELFWFSLFCLSILVRLFVDCSELLFILTSRVPWTVLVMADYLTLIWVPFLFMLFLAELYPQRVRHTERFALSLNVIVLSVLILTADTVMASALNTFLMIYLSLMALYILFKITRAIAYREPFARFIGAAVVVLFFGGAHDMLLSLAVIRGTYIFHLSTMVFSFLQAVMLAGRVADYVRGNEAMQTEIRRTNTAYERFVPADFIEKLESVDVVDLSLGDHVVDEITVLFAGIVAGHELYDALPDKEKISFLAGYIAIVDQCVRDHDGFIDKCVGTDAMVLFTRDPSGAYAASRAIEEGTRQYAHDLNIAIRIGVGVHTGQAALGIIGERERTESTVISDVVNMASRIKGANRYFGTTLLLSSAAYAHLSDAVQADFRFLGKFHLKGKDEPLPIYELFSDPAIDPTVAVKTETRDLFERAVIAYSTEQFGAARALFSQVLAIDPHDALARRYLERAALFMARAPRDPADLFEHVTTK